jgi:hypothetical protein
VGKAGERGGRLGEVRSFLGELYGPDLHTKRIDALAGATLGASLAVAMIGQALAQARGLVTRHAVKQVDRLLSNNGIDVWDSFARWVPHQVGSRGDVLVAMNWTDFDHGGLSTLVLSLVTGHGRAGPLLWLSSGHPSPTPSPQYGTRSGVSRVSSCPGTQPRPRSSRQPSVGTAYALCHAA